MDTAAALASGKYNKDSVLPNPAQLPFDGIDYSLPNYAGGNCYTRTEAGFAFALQQSCNTPFASIALDLGQDAIAEQAKKFGIGEDVGDQLKLAHATEQQLPRRPGRSGAGAVVRGAERCPGHAAADQHDDGSDRQRRRPDGAQPDQDPALS